MPRLIGQNIMILRSINIRLLVGLLNFLFYLFLDFYRYFGQRVGGGRVGGLNPILWLL